MAVKIRLKRTGTTNTPCFRIVVADVKSQRDGRAVEEVGFYNPVSKEKKIGVERIDYWIGKGAKMSRTVASLYAKAGGTNTGAVDKNKPTKATKATAKADAAT